MMAAGRALTTCVLLVSVLQAAGSVSLRVRYVGPVESESLSGKQHHEDLFGAFMSSVGRSYGAGTQEYQERLTTFVRRLAIINRFNARPNRTWTASVNQLTDRTDAELAQLLGWRGVAPKPHGMGTPEEQSLMRRRGVPTDPSAARIEDEDNSTHDNSTQDNSTYNRSNSTYNHSKSSFPTEYSYSHLFNSFIRDQEMCGSCWAIAASTVLGYHSEIHASNRTFSTQELVSCVPNPRHCGGTGGCDGATVEQAMQYAVYQGLKTPKENPYTALTTKCDSPVSQADMDKVVSFPTFSKINPAPPNAASRSFGMVGWERLAANAYQPLITALYLLGPVAVALAASDLHYYGSGLYDCSGVELDHYDWIVNHAVTLIGYGVDKHVSKKYWVIQNSWGPHWGENGTVRVLRRDNEQTHCGTNHEPQAGVACKGETEPVVVCGTCGVLYDSVVPYFRADLAPYFRANRYRAFQ